MKEKVSLEERLQNIYRESRKGKIKKAVMGLATAFYLTVGGYLMNKSYIWADNYLPHQTITSQEDYPQNDSYLKKFQAEREDVTKFFPFVNIRTFSRSGNEGLYGWVFRNSGYINIREGLDEEKKEETIIHETIHTSDEYETRRITDWIMSIVFPKRKRYHKITPKKYSS